MLADSVDLLFCKKAVDFLCFLVNKVPCVRMALKYGHFLKITDSVSALYTTLCINAKSDNSLRAKVFLQKRRATNLPP